MARKGIVLPPTHLYCVTILPRKTNTVKATVVPENRQHIKRSISLHKIIKLIYLFAVVSCDIIVTSCCVYLLYLPLIFQNKSFDMDRTTEDDRCLIMGLRTEKN